MGSWHELKAQGVFPASLFLIGETGADSPQGAPETQTRKSATADARTSANVELRTKFYFNLSASPISNNFLTNYYLDSQAITPQSLNSYYRLVPP